MCPALRKLHWTSASTATADDLLDREWLVTNGLGGYACGSLAGVPTRRYHALLVAALPAPLGRVTLLNRLVETLTLPDGQSITLGGEDSKVGGKLHPGSVLVEFCLEAGLPVWRYAVDSFVLEKRVMLAHMRNTTLVTYTLLSGDGSLALSLRPASCFRPLEANVASGSQSPQATSIDVDGARCELAMDPDAPPLRLAALGAPASFVEEHSMIELHYRVEESRGYEFEGAVGGSVVCNVTLQQGGSFTLLASTESWDAALALTPREVYEAELRRRTHLIELAHPRARTGLGAELVLAADQFIITPATRTRETSQAEAAGEGSRTVIAGYHWFTDWGRDTMISLEGLTLATGRHVEAGEILRTFARYVRDGLIPNMFPEGKNEGLYHTADASLWYFQAVARYLKVTNDTSTLQRVYPALRQIADAHLAGTRFGIGVDEKDGLLRQGAEGYQLTWMDAKVDGWVVTPRRGKAVEINALFYNALKLFAGWTRELHGTEAAQPYETAAERARIEFNRRFWYSEGGYLYDVVDGEQGDDDACRPNQLLAIALDYPILDRSRWEPVLRVCQEKLVTPVGLRSLSPDHPDYKKRYFGNLRTRDAAYHQGTVWAWLMGPYVDAYRKVYPDDRETLRSFVSGLTAHLDDACVGSISEIFDAEAPYTPRGCVAQAWSVAELLRVHLMMGE